jgi:peptidoglycan/LPS O-acetylase OafA/YrhL
MRDWAKWNRLVNGAGMYKGIEGLRAWLAWTVVFCHIVEGSGLTNKIPKGDLFFELGDSAVRVFIIISGFVITVSIRSVPRRVHSRGLWRRGSRPGSALWI